MSRPASVSPTVIFSVYDPKVEVSWSTPDPSIVCYLAARATQQSALDKGRFIEVNGRKAVKNALHAVALMGHTSVFEHAAISFFIADISRGCVDQLTRHRMGSFTCSSTHYNDHAHIKYLVDPRQIDNDLVHAALRSAHSLYVSERKRIGAEARQMMPLATACKVVWTVNARALINFLRLRMCKRNMDEMRLLAERVHKVAAEWFPDLFFSNAPYPECMRIGCDQGHMSCGKPWKEFN